MLVGSSNQNLHPHRKTPKIGIFKDRNHIYLGFNWHDAYAEVFESCGVPYAFLNPQSEETIKVMMNDDFDAFIWWAWHHPHDRANAKDKIFFLNQVLGRTVLPDWNMYWPYDNKIRQFYLMLANGIPTPDTFITFDRDEALNYAEGVRLPIISKGSSGACGFDVRKFDTRSDLVEYIPEVFSEEGAATSFPSVRQKNYVYFQEFIEARGDIRIVTIGRDVALAYWRVNEADWKFNINSGGRVEIENVPESAINLAVEATKKLCMHWCAYDIMIRNGQPVMVEYSATFGIVPPKICQVLFGSHHANIPIKEACYLLRHLERQGYNIPKRITALDSIQLL